MSFPEGGELVGRVFFARKSGPNRTPPASPGGARAAYTMPFWEVSTVPSAKPKAKAKPKPKTKSKAKPRAKKWTPKAVLAGVERYLASISRIVPITEKVETDELDKYGHKVKETVQVYNQLGEAMTRLEFLVPPTLTDLCLFLGVSRSTWYEWMQAAEKGGAGSEDLVRADALMRSFLDRENLARGGQRGVENALNWDHSVTTQPQTQAAPVTGGVEEFLAKLMAQGGGGPTF